MGETQPVGQPFEEAIIIPGISSDDSLYPIEKIEAHRQGALHLAISVFIFSGDALLIQRRAHHKYHCGGLWANTCCTHPHWGESNKASAKRRLQEELGIASIPLRETTVIEYHADVGGGLSEHERVHVYRGEADRRTLRIDCNQDEVCETRWIEPDALQREMAERPEVFTPWLRIYVARWSELYL
ncbi:MAG: isopentenyl-diphosphate Delta-isomerase [Hyphomicrobiales bacterium]|nr:isopentenyl-diphosphate Delta-isomerase [Hyphomicrobiales bacterium]